MQEIPHKSKVCTIKGLQRLAKECYFNSIGEVMETTRKKEGVSHTILKRCPQLEPASAMKEVHVGKEQLKIGATLEYETHTELIQLLEKK